MVLENLINKSILVGGLLGLSLVLSPQVDAGNFVRKPDLNLPIYDKRNSEHGFLIYRVDNRSGEVVIGAKFRDVPKPHSPDLWCQNSKRAQNDHNGKFSFYCRDSSLGRIDRHGNVPRAGRLLHRGANGGTDGKGGNSKDYRTGIDF
jgi:hypothetical protein